MIGQLAVRAGKLADGTVYHTIGSYDDFSLTLELRLKPVAVALGSVCALAAASRVYDR